MTLRNSSGKFSLSAFGRKSSGVQEPSSPTRATANLDDPNSPTQSGFGNGGGGGGGGSNAFDGLGRKLAKGIAHQSLLPALGNKDLRVLQDIISTEKGVLTSTERLGIDTQKAANALPPFGAQEGPDLQDVLTHSSTLLNQLGTALAVFVDHSANLRTCFKRIREREEELDDLRRRRRATGAKAETAEKKLAKMGPENKALPSQTELLERLRSEMRQMDTDIISEESKLGDFKRRQIKEALSYKFGGLEELGEKMCIIGELGKLLLEEIPLEETPPGYGRAPYLGYDKTENAVNEATKCLATVKFVAGSADPRPPGLPPHNPTERLTTPQLPHSHNLAAAEEYANYPGGSDAVSPQAKETTRNLSTYGSNPYGGMSNPYEQGQSSMYDDFGGTRGGNDRHVVFQGPPDDVVNGEQHHQERTAADYEYEQQRQLDAEERAWRETPGHSHSAEQQGFPAPSQPAHSESQQPAQGEQTVHGDQPNGLHVPWQPLKVNKDRSATPIALHDGAAPPRLDAPDLGERITAPESDNVNSPTEILMPPPPIGGFANAGPPTPSDRGDRDGFYTPTEGPTPEPHFPAQVPTPQAPSAPPPPAPIPVPSPALPSPASYTTPSGSGKISAAAFRRGTKPRNSTDPEEMAYQNGRSPDSISQAPRRLPQPPGTSAMPGGFGRPATPLEADYDSPVSPIVAQNKRASGEAYGDAGAEDHPPPVYHAEGHPDSLR